MEILTNIYVFNYQVVFVGQVKRNMIKMFITIPLKHSAKTIAQFFSNQEDMRERKVKTNFQVSHQNKIKEFSLFASYFSTASTLNCQTRINCTQEANNKF